MKTAEAFAKVNLTLHVTGQRRDGYHLLDSLVVFAEICDRISFAPEGPAIEFTVGGPFAKGVPTDHSNLIWRAAEIALGGRGGRFHLEKNLPHAAGLGGGSSDAAATLRLVAGALGEPVLGASDPRVAKLGADVPVCLHAPHPCRMSGIGEVVKQVNGLPDAALVLVNPRVEVPTAAVFAALTRKDNAPMAALPQAPDFAGFAAWLAAQRNDLQSAAISLAPAIGAALAALSAHKAVAWSGMSGSGATCVGLVPDIEAARRVATKVSKAHPDWWIQAAPMLGPR